MGWFPRTRWYLASNTVLVVDVRDLLVLVVSYGESARVRGGVILLFVLCEWKCRVISFERLIPPVL